MFANEINGLEFFVYFLVCKGNVVMCVALVGQVVERKRINDKYIYITV